MAPDSWGNARDLDVQHVDASVIDDDIMISSSSFEIDMSVVQREIAELTDAIDEALTTYGDLLVDPDQIALLPASEAQRCERELSGAIRRANDVRLQLGRDYRGPLNTANERYKELMGPVEELHARYKQRRLAIAEEEAQRKIAEVRAYYEQIAPTIALPAEGQEVPLVPFERILERHGAKWHQKSMALDALKGQVAGIVADIEAGERRIDEAQPKHALEAKARFWQTLDAQAALDHDAELCALEERQAAREAARLAREAERAAAAALEERARVQPDPGAGAQSAAAQTVQVRKPRVMLIDGATDDECRQIAEVCKSLGITGVFKGPRFYEAAKAIDI